MSTAITMPQLGLTMTYGTIRQCLKAKGDPVKKDEVLFEMSTDKLTHQIQSPRDGVLLEILAEEGADYTVGIPLAYVGEAGESVEVASSDEPPRDTASEPSAVEQKPEEPTENKNPEKQGRHPGFKEALSVVSGSARWSHDGGISPKARRVAKELGVSRESLRNIPGTGPMGWIVEKDVRDAFASGAHQNDLSGSAPVKATPVAVKLAENVGVDLNDIKTEGRQSKIMKRDVLLASSPVSVPQSVHYASGRRVPVSPMRRIIGERMTLSASIPTVCFTMDVDFTETMAFLAQLNGDASMGVKITYNDVLMKLCAVALLENPMMNASLDGDEFILHDSVNIGLAVALEGGLVVPNVKNVERKGIRGIAEDRAKLVAAAKSMSLASDACSSGTFTITNLGMFGITSFTPLINPPEAAILGVSAIGGRPSLVDGVLVNRPVCSMTLTVDHRIVDGADVARFLARLKQMIESPVRALV